MSNKSLLSSPFGDYSIALNSDNSYSDANPLKGFNAADEYLLNHLSEIDFSKYPKTLIVNDKFGALTLSLASKTEITCYGDSINSFNAIKNNAYLNNVDVSAVKFLPVNEKLYTKFDLVIIKMPNSFDLLEFQLQQIYSHVKTRNLIIAAEMVKYVTSPLLQKFESNIGKVTTSKAVKKARLIFSELNTELELPTKKLVKEFVVSDLNIKIQEEKLLPLNLVNYPGTFSSGKLDQGSRLLLENLRLTEKDKIIYDLGCGNGVLGIVAAKVQPKANLYFFDESYLAIESAKESWEKNQLANKVYYYTASQINETIPKADVILCNPPYHIGNTRSNEIALLMFEQAKNQLNPGGRLIVVSNHHLNYITQLKKHFSRVKEKEKNSKYHIIIATQES